jgi:tripartite-type tricarboxylate transporter receptor subunit TctC
MNIRRRDFLRLTVSAAALPVLSRTARADVYPNRPVRIVVGLGPGSAADVAARLVAQSLAERLGQPFVIENRVGAAGRLAAETVMRAPADGYMLLLTNSADQVNASLYDDFGVVHEIAPVASIANGPLVLVVHPSLPVKTVPEFITYAKANPGKVNFGSSGTGSLVQMAGELFKVMAGVDMVHVPYRGMVPALIDLIGGRVQAVFSTLPPAIEHVKGGKLRALAVTTTTRSESLPDLPTISEFLPGYEANFALGLGAPKNTPAEIVDTLNKQVNVALADRAIKARLANLGAAPLRMTSGDYGKFRVEESEKWRKVIRTANIKLK